MHSRQIVLTLLILISTLTAAAKTGGITGKIIDKDGQPVPGVNVVVLAAADNKLVKADLSDEKGAFSIDPVPDGQYILKATFLGYEPYTSEKLTVAGGNLNMPVITLQEKAATLKEATVQAHRPLIEIKADKLIVNVENSIVNAGS